MRKVPLIFLGLGISLLITIGVLGWIVIPEILTSKIAAKVQLVNGTETWEKWAHVSTPIFMNIYIFNTTNPEEVKKGAKPILQEFGPYVYEEKRVKVDIQLNESSHSVLYRQPVRYFFRPDLSNGTEEDRFQILNIPLVVLTTLGAQMGFLAQMVLGGVLDDHPEEQLFMDVSAEELLFKGRYIPMMKTLEATTGKSVLTNYTFGLYYPKNGSDEGVMEVKTGVDDPTHFGRIVSWNGKTELNYWDDHYCNMINGTDGSLFPPFVTRDRILRMFSADLCRSLYLKYDRDVVYNGIPGYRFSVPKEMLGRSDDNHCFCKDPGLNMTNCPKGGAIDLSVCRKGAPIYMSTAHFLDGAQEYVDMVEGLRPDRERHLTYIDLEANTGLMLQVQKRIQVNVHLTPNTLSDTFNDVPDIIYPIVWMDEGAKMGEETQDAVRNLVIRPVAVIDAVRWVCLGLGAVFVIAGLLMLGNLHLRKFGEGKMQDKALSEFKPSAISFKNTQ